MSEEKQLPTPTPTPTPTLPTVLWQLAGLVFKREALLVVTTGAVLVASGASFAVWAQSKLDGGIAPVREELRQHVLEEERRHAAEEQQYRQVKEDLHEVQMDIRALYRAVQTGQPQPRLERPLPQPIDGGAP